MNLRPPGYEPGELPDCSTPRRDRHHSTGLSPITLALLVSVVAVLATLAFVGSRSLALYRDARSFTKALAGELDTLALSTDQLGTREPPDVERLSKALARLEASRARLSVLTGALDRVRKQWDRLLAVYPRK